jgi:DNA-binding beta-propeller fold protein YncE
MVSKYILVPFLFVAALGRAQSSGPAAPAYAVSQIFQIGGDGGWDYLTVDSDHNLLYVPRVTHTQVIDGTSGAVVADIPGQTHNHGVAIVPSAGRGFITDGEDASVVIFDLQTYQVLGKIKAQDDADGVIYDPASNKVLVVCGDPGVMIPISPDVDPKSGSADPAIDLGGKPEFLASDGHGKVYVNLTDKAQVAVVDTKTMKVVARWATAPGASPVGLSIDPERRRLFIGCRKPQKLVVMSADDGTILADLPIGPGVDATKFNGDAYASCRDGTLAVVRETAPGKIELVQTVKTKPGARTMGVDSKTGAIYLPTAEFAPPASGQGRPVAQPGTFMIVVVKPEAAVAPSAQVQPGATALPATASKPDKEAVAALRQDQQAKFSALDQALADQNAAVIADRAALVHASFAVSRDDADIQSKIVALKNAELELANLRSEYLGLVEANTASLSLDQIGTLMQQGLHGGAAASAQSAVRLGRFHQPDPFEFEDHAGFTQIFDGTTLNNWDGDPSVWSVKDGAILGVSTKEKPVRNTYISYHGAVMRDFDLKMEIKVLGPGGSGIQYRSAVGVPWRQKLPVGAAPLNLNWMMTGPQADYWPIRPYSGQFYSENTPLGIVAWRGQVVNSIAGKRPLLVGTIANLAELETYVRTNDWNQYEIIARGGTMMHIINGQLMVVEVDDDPASTNNATGLIGIELESSPCQVFARDIWLRKIQ